MSEQTTATGLASSLGSLTSPTLPGWTIPGSRAIPSFTTNREKRAVIASARGSIVQGAGTHSKLSRQVVGT